MTKQGNMTPPKEHNYSLELIQRKKKGIAGEGIENNSVKKNSMRYKRIQRENSTKSEKKIMIWMKTSTETGFSKRSQMEIMKLKNSTNQNKNIMESLNSRLDQAEEIISKLEDRSFEITQ